MPALPALVRPGSIKCYHATRATAQQGQGPTPEPVPGRRVAAISSASRSEDNAVEGSPWPSSHARVSRTVAMGSVVSRPLPRARSALTSMRPLRAPCSGRYSGSSRNDRFAATMISFGTHTGVSTPSRSTNSGETRAGQGIDSGLPITSRYHPGTPGWTAPLLRSGDRSPTAGPVLAPFRAMQ